MILPMGIMHKRLLAGMRCEALANTRTRYYTVLTGDPFVWGPKGLDFLTPDRLSLAVAY